jgi:ABC-type cobalamin transport system ATPase subunit
MSMAKTLKTGITLFLNNKGQVLTNGNLDRILPPSLFKEVVHVQLRRETISEERETISELPQ